MAKIDLNIFNALNLINPALGKAYYQKGYNPFDDEFVLQNDYVQELLGKAKDKQHIKTEDFLEQGNKEIAEIFKLAQKNTEQLQNELEVLNKSNLKNVIIFLKNRKELLSQAVKKLKNEKANSFLLYKDIVGIDTLYSEIVKETFFENFDKNIIIQNFLKVCKPQKKQDSHKKQEQIVIQNMLATPPKPKENVIEIPREKIVENNIIKPQTYAPKQKREMER